MEKSKVLNYRDWLNLIPKAERQFCATCAGNGECKCAHCGSEYPCQTCGGDGFLIDGQEPLKLYLARVEQENALYSQWMESIGQAEKAIESELK